MVELQYPPYSAELHGQTSIDAGPLPLALLKEMLWSRSEDRDDALAVIANLHHSLQAPDGTVHQFAIADHVPNLIEAITMLDMFDEASSVGAIGWDEEAQRHVLVDAELRGLDPDGFPDELRAFLVAVMSTERR